jgi:hypothetical protein
MAVIGLCACESGGSRSTVVSEDSQQPSGAEVSSDSHAENPHRFTRPCGDSVFGDLGHGWRRSSIASGPLAFVGARRGYRHAPARRFESRRGRYRPQKMLAVVDNGPDVEVRVPFWERRHVALVYDPELFNRRLKISKADYRVNFDACRDDENPFGKRTAQFNGAFLVAGTRCVVLEVIAGAGSNERIAISFGHRCAVKGADASDQAAQ